MVLVALDHSEAAIGSQEPKRKGATNARTEYHYLDQYRPAGPASLRSADLLVEPSSLARPEYGLRGLARFVTVKHYVLSHLLGSRLVMILAIFGVFASVTYVTSSHAWRLGLVAMIITVLGSSPSLMIFGVSTFAATAEGQAYLRV